MTTQTTIHLQPYFFAELEKTLAEVDGIAASIFRYPSGVAALRLKNAIGEIVVLPFQGQQVWDAQFYGRTLTMKSMFDQPYPTQTYLQTYGGFVVHCGATAMGVPEAGDNHPLHGELPNAPYLNAALLIGKMSVVRTWPSPARTDIRWLLVTTTPPHRKRDCTPTLAECRYPSPSTI